MTRFALGTWPTAQLELSDWGIRVSAIWPFPTWEVRYYELRTVQPIRWRLAAGILFRADASVATYGSRWSALPMVFLTLKSGCLEILAQLEARGVSVEKEVVRLRMTELWT
jgi:hypothetical protein